MSEPKPPTILTLRQIKDGTGFARDAQFLQLPATYFAAYYGSAYGSDVELHPTYDDAIRACAKGIGLSIDDGMDTEDVENALNYLRRIGRRLDVKEVTLP